MAFFAIVERGSLGRVRGDENIVFERAVTNVGDAYDPTNGKFTAPVSGVYQFSSSIMADNSAEVWCRFTLNDKPVAYIYARGTDQRHNQGSQTVILQLNKGEYSRLSLSRIPRDSLKYFEISVVRHIRFAELRKK